MESFYEKIAAITGAGSGLGRGMALHAAGEGMRVVVADVTADRVDAGVAGLEARGDLESAAAVQAARTPA